jgi:hypothetical protein
MNPDKMNESVQRIAMPRSIRRITVLRQDPSGGVAVETVYRRSGRKKKTTPLLRPLENATRRIADAQSRATQSYVVRHNRSNRKRRDGWIVDFPSNVLYASQKGTRALRLNRFIIF